MRSDSPSSGSDAIRLDEMSSMPINRCDPYNAVYVSPHSNMVVVGVSNGVIFLTLRQEKPASSYQHELFTEVVQTMASPDSSSSLRPGPVGSKGEPLFRTSLQIVSAVEIDFQNEDPVGRYRPSFINGLTEELAESFYYDSFLSQKPASRQQAPITLSRSLFRTSGAHVVKLFSVLVSFDKSNGKSNDDQKTGSEVVFAVTSTGGWYAFSCLQWTNPQRPIWQRVDSWQSAAPLLSCAITPEAPSEPSEVCEGYLRALHSVATRDLTAAESNKGRVLLFIINGLGQLLAYVVDISNSTLRQNDKATPSSNSPDPAVDKPSPTGKLMDLAGESRAVSCCYIAQSRDLAYSCEDGRIYLLRGITPFYPPESTGNGELEISYASSQLIWPYPDIMVDLLQVVPAMPTGNSSMTIVNESKSCSSILVAAKGSFLIACTLPSFTTAFCHVDAFPIISISALKIPNNNEGRYIAKFLVCTQKGIHIASLVQSSSDDAPQLTCSRILSVDEISSPLGSNHDNNNGGVAAPGTLNIASSLNDLFRRRHLSTNHWLFLGFSGSPGFNFFVAATGIFCPCKASLLLAPPFSLKLFSRRKIELAAKNESVALANNKNKPSFWDEPLYDLATSVKSEADLIELAQKFSTLARVDFPTLNYRFVLLQRACFAYSNGCLQVSAPPEVFTAKNAIKRALIKTHLQNLVQRLLPLEHEIEGNLVKWHGYLSDIGRMCSILNIELPKRFTDIMAQFGEVAAFARQECLVCKMALTTKLAEEVESVAKDAGIICSCSNNHIFRPCAKSLLPCLPPNSSDMLPSLPVFCPNCSEPTLKFRPPIEEQSMFENSLNSLMLQPCAFCGSYALP